MKSKLLTRILCIFFLAMLILPSLLSEYSYLWEDLQLNPNDYARITDVDYTAIVVDEPDSEGKVLIRELLTFDVHAASEDNLFWELWRDLPEDNIDGVKVDYTVYSVKQILADGTEIIYEKSPKLYWDDYDYVSTNPTYGPGKWYHSDGPYNESAAQYECVFFYVDGLYREQVVFEIIYEMHNAALKYNDCSDLYLSLYSGSTIKHLNSFKAQILFPNEDMPSPGNYTVTTYGTNANEFPVMESATLHPGYYTFSFELDEEDLQFKPYNQYIEFDLVATGEDKHIFTEYAPTNHYSYSDVLDEIYEEQHAYASAPEKYNDTKALILLLSIAGVALLGFYCFTTDRRMNAKHLFFKPASEEKYCREIPSDLDPHFAAALVFCKHKAPKDDSGVYSAILLSLARKKYIEIEEIGTESIQILIRKRSPQVPAPTTLTGISTSGTIGTSDIGASGITGAADTATGDLETAAVTYEPLTPCEEYYFNLLVRHASGNSISMNMLQHRISSDYEYTDSFVKNMEHSTVNIGVKDGYFQKADYAQPRRQLHSVSKFLFIVGILLLTLVNIISYQTRMELAFGAYFVLGIGCIAGSLYLKEQAKKYILLTQFGEDEYAKWRGLYRYLSSDALKQEQIIIDLSLWEKYLVYAEAFGLSEKANEALRIRMPQATESATASSPVISNTYYHARRIRRYRHSFRSAVHSGSHSAHYGGGSFGGGGFGYGGGGRGGGGGGGGH